jgi:hypothetical protein
MYKANSAVKIIVLVCFAALMSAFVAYRSGAFDKYIDKESSEKVSAEDNFLTLQKDTVPPSGFYIDRNELMASSKSISVTPTYKYRPVSVKYFEEKKAKAISEEEAWKSILNKDTTKPLPADSVLKAREAKERLLMSSSKSMIIIDRPKTVKPDTVAKPVSDTVNKVLPDTAKPIRFYGSKSGIIFKPDDVKVIDKKEKKKLKKKNKTSG